MTALAIGAGMSMLGSIQQGQAEKQAKDAQAQEYEQQAEQAKVAAQEEAKRIRAAGEKTVSASRTAMAGAGVVADQGSAVNINEDIYQKSESDAYNVLLTGDNRASSYKRSASMARKAGADAQSASLLRGATSVVSSFAGWKGGPKGGGAGPMSRYTSGNSGSGD
jgi:hypothetical protein